MKFKALRPVYGDHGLASPGEVFEVPDHLVKKYTLLEGRGVVMRHRERPLMRKAYTVYENKAITPASNKSK